MKLYKIKLVKKPKGEGFIIKGIVTHYWLFLKTGIEVVDLDSNYRCKYNKAFDGSKQNEISFNEAILVTKN